MDNMGQVNLLWTALFSALWLASDSDCYQDDKCNAGICLLHGVNPARKLWM